MVHINKLSQKNSISHKEKGSFMLEFLVALGIFSICITGLVTLQTKAIRILSENRDAMSNGFLLEDAVARVSSNIKNLSSYASGSPDKDGTIAEQDLFELKRNAANFNRAISITKEGTVTDDYKITISGGGSDTVTYTFRFDDYSLHLP